jgi:hypothetical protein
VSVRGWFATKPSFAERAESVLRERLAGERGFCVDPPDGSGPWPVIAVEACAGNAVTLWAERDGVLRSFVLHVNEEADIARLEEIGR